MTHLHGTPEQIIKYFEKNYPGENILTGCDEYDIKFHVKGYDDHFPMAMDDLYIDLDKTSRWTIKWSY